MLLKYPADNYMFKVNNRNTRKSYKISSKLTIKEAELTIDTSRTPQPYGGLNPLNTNSTKWSNTLKQFFCQSR